MPTLQEMDQSALEAEKEFGSLPTEEVRRVLGWWQKWFRLAGYKRLGRILAGKNPIAKKGRPEEES